MKKIIRPLSWYKKVYKEWYEFYTTGLFRDDYSGSVKNKENQFYYNFGFYILYSERNVNLDGKFDKFFFLDENTRNNKTLITEFGRLKMYGLYYEYHYSDAPDITDDICRWIKSSWEKKNSIITDSVFVSVVKYIRENYLYYIFNRDELKIYILEQFFPDEVKPMLPEKPKELQIEEILNDISEVERKKNLKENPNYYWNKSVIQEDYIEYLQSFIIDGKYYDQVMTYEDFEKEYWGRHFQRINNMEKLRKNYDSNKLQILKESAIKMINTI